MGLLYSLLFLGELDQVSISCPDNLLILLRIEHADSNCRTLCRQRFFIAHPTTRLWSIHICHTKLIFNKKKRDDSTTLSMIVPGYKFQYKKIKLT